MKTLFQILGSLAVLLVMMAVSFEFIGLVFRDGWAELVWVISWCFAAHWFWSWAKKDAMAQEQEIARLNAIQEEVRQEKLKEAAEEKRLRAWDRKEKKAGRPGLSHSFIQKD